MTITEMLVMPKGMDFLEYENLLREKHKLEKQISRNENGKREPSFTEFIKLCEALIKTIRTLMKKGKIYE